MADERTGAQPMSNEDYQRAMDRLDRPEGQAGTLRESRQEANRDFGRAVVRPTTSGRDLTRGTRK
jgi:hypothetical protein